MNLYDTGWNEEGKGKNGLVVTKENLQRSELEDFQYVQVGTIKCPIKEQKCNNQVLSCRHVKGRRM